jgi:hypothetical protein
MPPEEEIMAGRWSYQFPLTGRLPIPTDTFLHYTRHPEEHTGQTWVKRLPKKLDISMYKEQGELPMGWGVQIIEGPNRAVIAWIFAALAFLSCIAAIVWSAVKGDIQGGTGLGQLLLSVLATVLAVTFALYIDQTEN